MTIELYPPLSLFAQGKRENMEDYIYPLHNTAQEEDKFFIVCDGMGGHAKGEVASKLASEELAGYLNNNKPETIAETIFINAFEHVQDVFDNYIAEHPETRGMGTTIVTVYLHGKTALVMHCGDSRCYHFRGQEILFRTKDHKLVEEWADQGIISREAVKSHPKKNVLTRAIQGKGVSKPKPDIHFIHNIRIGDYFLLCTDGVNESLNDAQIAEIIGSEISDPDKLNLMQSMCEGNSNDNYSAYLLRIRNISD